MQSGIEQQTAALQQNHTHTTCVITSDVTHLVVVEVLPLSDVLLDSLGLLLFLLLVLLINHVTLVI
jgi:hypothetical protein